MPPPAAIDCVHELHSITAPFFPLADVGQFEAVVASELPADYQALLAHDDHMTVTVEAFFGSLVDVRVLQQLHDGDFYRRTSLLVCQSTGRVVQFGAICIDLRGLPEIVRGEIERGRTPLGRVLIRHNILRRVELRRLWRVAPGPVLCRHLGIRQSASGESYPGSFGTAYETPPVANIPELHPLGGGSDARYGWRPPPAAGAGSAAERAPAASPPSGTATEPLCTATDAAVTNPYIYGRTARIVVEDRPAVQLLEIVKV